MAVEIHGKGIFLRPLEEKDVGEDYLGWMRDPQVVQYLADATQVHTLESLRTFVRSMSSSARDHLLGIFLAEGGEHIGNIKIGNVREVHRSADLGLIIGRRSAWGKGYGTEAVALATRCAFEQLDLNKLWAGMYAENVGCYRAFTRAGYREVGRFHQHMFFNGQFVDAILVEKCRDENRAAGIPPAVS